MYQKFSKATENKNLVSADLSEKRILLSSLETQTAEIVAEDKQLNHNFKREFIEAEPFYNKLLHMYRFRAANQVRASALLTCGERRVYAQSMETECGEQDPGVEQAMHRTEHGVDCILPLVAPVPYMYIGIWAGCAGQPETNTASYSPIAATSGTTLSPSATPLLTPHCPILSPLVRQQDDEIVHRALTSTNSKIQRSMSIGSQHSHPTGAAPSALVPGSLAAKEMLMQDLALNTLEAFPPVGGWANGLSARAGGEVLTAR